MAINTIAYKTDHAIAQAVSRRLRTAGGPGSSTGQVMWDLWWKSGTGADFLRVLRFSLPILIPPTAPHSSSSIIRGWYYRQISGQRKEWTKSQRIKFERGIVIFKRSVFRDINPYSCLKINRRAQHATCFILISCLLYYSTLKKKAKCCSETSVDFQRTTWSNCP
jgi:hypothetical protein